MVDWRSLEQSTFCEFLLLFGHGGRDDLHEVRASPKSKFSSASGRGKILCARTDCDKLRRFRMRDPRLTKYDLAVCGLLGVSPGHEM